MSPEYYDRKTKEYFALHPDHTLRLIAKAYENLRLCRWLICHVIYPAVGTAA